MGRIDAGVDQVDPGASAGGKGPGFRGAHQLDAPGNGLRSPQWKKRQHAHSGQALNTLPLTGLDVIYQRVVSESGSERRLRAYVCCAHRIVEVDDLNSPCAEEIQSRGHRPRADPVTDPLLERPAASRLLERDYRVSRFRRDRGDERGVARVPSPRLWWAIHLDGRHVHRTSTARGRERRPIRGWIG